MLSKLFIAGVLAIAVASAQRGGGGGMGTEGTSPMERSEANARSGGGSTNRMEMWSEMLKLSKDQKKQIKTIMDEGQKEAVPVKDQMTKTRTAIAEAVAAGKSAEEIKQASAAFAAVEMQMHQIELNSFAKIYQTLEKDQQAKIRPVFATMSGVFKGKNWIEMN